MLTLQQTFFSDITTTLIDVGCDQRHRYCMPLPNGIMLHDHGVSKYIYCKFYAQYLPTIFPGKIVVPIIKIIEDHGNK